MRERLLSLLLLICLATVADAQLPRTLIREDYDPTGTLKTELRVTPLFDGLPSSGYFPVRVSIFNDGKVSQTWRFNFASEDSSYSDEGSTLRSEFAVTCDSKERKEVDLLVPVVTALQSSYASTTLDISVNAPAPFPGSSNSLTTYYDETWPSVLVSERIDNLNRGALSSEVNALVGGAASRYGPTANIEFGAPFNPKFVPEDWRSYAGYDACVLTEADWGDLSVGSKNALLNWNRLGGSLLIYASAPDTTLATLGIDPAAVGQKNGVRSWGSVRIGQIPSSGILDAKAAVTAISSTIPAITGAHRLESLRQDFRSAWPLKMRFGSVAANIVFFILILIAFGILVGPVNLFVFARAGRRHKLFITTPLISLSASALLVVLILFQDGFGGRGIRAVLMEIGPDNSAYVSQEQIARTGVLLNTSFSTEEHGYLTPVVVAESRWARVTQENQGGKGRYNVDLQDDGLRATGDWFKSRSEHGHLFETIRPTRAGITLVRGGRDPVISSTFEFPLESLYYLDPDGDLWSARDIQQGHNTTLQLATAPEFDRWLSTEDVRFSSRNRHRIALAKGRPGHFFASTNQAPGLPTLTSINWKDTHTLITGAVARP